MLSGPRNEANPLEMLLILKKSAGLVFQIQRTRRRRGGWIYPAFKHDNVLKMLCHVAQKQVECLPAESNHFGVGPQALIPLELLVEGALSGGIISDDIGRHRVFPHEPNIVARTPKIARGGKAQIHEIAPVPKLERSGRRTEHMAQTRPRGLRANGIRNKIRTRTHIKARQQ